MPDIDSLLNRWQAAGLLDAEIAARIRTFEAGEESPRGLRWQGLVALSLGAVLLAAGVVLFVSAHWDRLGPGARLFVVALMVSVFHLGGAFARSRFGSLSTALHAVGTVSTGAAIALVGQIFNIQEHWPAAVLLWALAALAGWILLRDQAQQTLVFLLVPAWLLCEIEKASMGGNQDVLAGRFLFVWAILYLTVFIGSPRRIVTGVLFAVAAVAAVLGTVSMTVQWFGSWRQWSLSPWTVTWIWVVTAVLPVTVAFLRARRSLLPVVVAVGYAALLPLLSLGRAGAFHEFFAQLLVAGFAIFLLGWGVRQTSRGLVNFGIVGFGLAVAWFYFSTVFDKVGRSLGLIGIGILFLAGGWLLEKTRRGLLARMGRAPAPEPAP